MCEIIGEVERVKHDTCAWKLFFVRKSTSDRLCSYFDGKVLIHHSGLQRSRKAFEKRHGTQLFLSENAAHVYRARNSTNLLPRKVIIPKGAKIIRHKWNPQKARVSSYYIGKQDCVVTSEERRLLGI